MTTLTLPSRLSICDVQSLQPTRLHLGTSASLIDDAGRIAAEVRLREARGTLPALRRADIAQLLEVAPNGRRVPRAIACAVREGWLDVVTADRLMMEKLDVCAD